jgi:hypothetical protein
MFSKDGKYYRAVPRTMNEAFGPYSKLNDVEYYKVRGRAIAAALGVIALGIFYGWMMTH